MCWLLIKLAAGLLLVAQQGGNLSVFLIHYIRPSLFQFVWLHYIDRSLFQYFEYIAVIHYFFQHSNYITLIHRDHITFINYSLSVLTTLHSSKRFQWHLIAFNKPLIAAANGNIYIQFAPFANIIPRNCKSENLSEMCSLRICHRISLFKQISESPAGCTTSPSNSYDLSTNIFCQYHHCYHHQHISCTEIVITILAEQVCKSSEDK